MTKKSAPAAFRFFLLLPLLLASTHVSAALITYTTQFLGGASYRHDYTITHQIGEDPVHLIDIEFDQAPGADIVDAGKAQPFQRVMDRPPLGVEHAVLQADMDADFHG